MVSLFALAIRFWLELVCWSVFLEKKIIDSVMFGMWSIVSENWSLKFTDWLGFSKDWFDTKFTDLCLFWTLLNLFDSWVVPYTIGPSFRKSSKCFIFARRIIPKTEDERLFIAKSHNSSHMEIISCKCSVCRYVFLFKYYSNSVIESTIPTATLYIQIYWNHEFNAKSIKVWNQAEICRCMLLKFSVLFWIYKSCRFLYASNLFCRS